MIRDIPAVLQLPAKLYTDLLVSDDHIGHSATQSGNAESRSVCDLDSFNGIGRDLAQCCAGVIALSRDPLAVNQDILAGLSKSPIISRFRKREIWDLVDNIQSSARGKTRKF
ncbi:hypothetical protein GV829_05215 [Sphingomonas lacunae]|uniref:Uncharacterized protein n=1 Tax=Sphingomonas lacunae TaxID=2698828 RepID=A0A6M4AS92_9SPHN|nr:hypothetical protein [Sphingomonas lacunae]QJQ31923.1 hypothetical protein GV829_05215 [Sphingomonas lacunae]